MLASAADAISPLTDMQLLIINIALFELTEESRDGTVEILNVIFGQLLKSLRQQAGARGKVDVGVWSGQDNQSANVGMGVLAKLD